MTNQTDDDRNLIDHVMYKDMGDLCAVFDYGCKNVKRYTIQDILAAQSRITQQEERQRAVEICEKYQTETPFTSEYVALQKAINEINQ